ncbi:hypothetical protein ABVK25_003039 [Lepraria finkii]|uniref:Uncharacterized protein n=1 Tax=Lepraria finkii TaxID=1340010 RepID=A0ABR4BFM5_9LECA
MPSSSNFLPPLPATTYVPPKGSRARRALASPNRPLVDAPVGDQIMPTDEMVKAFASKRRIACPNTKNAFLPPAVLEE